MKSKPYLFNVDLMIDAETNAQALEKLLRLLHSAEIADYRIVSGIQAGRLIEMALADPSGHKALNIPQKLQSKPGSKPEAAQAETKQAGAKPAEAKPAAGKTSTQKNDEIQEALARIRGYIADNKLIRLAVNKGRGVKLSVPCRILNIDESNLTVTIYHVDEKMVYTFGLNEIDDFVEG